MKPKLFFLCVGLLSLLAGCAKPAASIAAVTGNVAYYTCTMHPSVRSLDPDGKCPICGMDLVPVMKTDAKGEMAQSPAMPGQSADQPHEFTVPLNRQQLIGVTYAVAGMKPLRRTVRVAGVVAATTANHWDYVARVDGYIHNLHIFAPGDRVAKGQVLMDLYSPDLVATENEYVDLLRMREQGRREQNPAAVQNAEHLLSGARVRLEQWNISEAQIDGIEQRGKADEFLDLTSPVAGVVEEVKVHQGRHVAVGDHLADLVDLSAVWVWAEFYENELPLLKPGLAVTITSVAMPGVALAGKIAAIDPFLDPTKRTAKTRIDVANPGFKLLPDAYVDVALEIDAGEGLTVPASAVLPTGQHNVVFVDKGEGRLEPRFVELGGQFGDDYRVTAGLRAGERVVSSANFLIDAESKVQGALKDF
jgi:Cu(I)/Ag(I) efflux system membrane fusion protein